MFLACKGWNINMRKIAFVLIKLCLKVFLIIKSFFYRTCNYINFVHHRVLWGKNLKIRGFINLYGRGKIEIGNNVIVNSSMSSNPIGGSSTTIYNTFRNGSIIIKNNVGMSNVALCAMKSIVIEEDVMLGGGVKIYDTDFHSIPYNCRMEYPDKNIKIKPVLIKKGSFIGTDAIILKGVTIGEKSVIGARSVVTSDVPDGEIWAGNPAKFIKKIDI